jgi:hypothetical protein
MSEQGQKSIKNLVCGFNECNKPSTRKIVFRFGFSAGFCNECAELLIRQGLGELGR